MSAISRKHITPKGYSFQFTFVMS